MRPATCILRLASCEVRGYHCLRRGGWDTHGLPVELEVEKELGLESKGEIEKYGVAEFNEKLFLTNTGSCQLVAQLDYRTIGLPD